MPRILATTDSSVGSSHAVRYAQALARALGAKLTVLAVQPVPFPVGARRRAAWWAFAQAGRNSATISDQRRFRASLVAALPDLSVRIERARGRPIHQVIVQVAEEEGAGMIVMSTHGRGGLDLVLMGSVAQAVVRHSPVPVLLIRREQPLVNWKSAPQVLSNDADSFVVSEKRCDKHDVFPLYPRGRGEGGAERRKG